MPTGTAISVWAIAIIAIGYKVIGLSRNIVAAKATGIPYTLTLALETEVLGHILNPILRRVYRGRLLRSQGWPQWCRFMIREWAWEDGRRAHEEYGEVFLVVSPEGIICYSADATLNSDVTSRRHDFIKPRDKYKLLEPYGPNVSTVEGDHFRFHLRITAPSFHESSGINSLVWNETSRQAKCIVASWSENAPENCHWDIKGLTLAVIALAGFGRRIDWNQSHAKEVNEAHSSHKLTFQAACAGVIRYLLLILLVPKWFLQCIGLRHAAAAHRELGLYLRESIKSERESATDRGNESHVAKGNLLTSLVRASTAENGRDVKPIIAGSKKSFTDDEVMGNLFIFLIGGTETSAHTMLYCLITLALYPQFHDRITNEIDRVYHEARAEGRTELTYTSDFQKLEYTFCFVCEILRLFPPVIWITKMVQKPTAVTISSDHKGGKRTHTLPSQCRIYLNVPATHYSGHNWMDPKKIDPLRWTCNSNDSRELATSRLREDSVKSNPGRFLAFSDGARGCLGRKFAEVEVVAFLATILRDKTVELGKGLDRERVEKDLFDRCAEQLTLAPLPYITVRLSRREGRNANKRAYESL